MQARTLEEWSTSIKEVIQMNEGFQKLLMPLLIARPQIKDIFNILTAQTDALKKKSEALEPLHSFYFEYLQIDALLAKLDEDFLAWEAAIRENKGNGVSAFLDAAEPITESMRKNLEALVTKRQDQISRGAHRLPAGLDKPLQELIEENKKIDAAIKNPPPTEEEAKSVAGAIYYNMWKRISKTQKGEVADLENGKEFLKKSSKEYLGDIIKRYQLQAKQLFTTYNELIDVEEGVEVPLKDLAEAKALREERQSQLAAMPSLDKSAQHTLSDDGSLMRLIESQKASILGSASSKHPVPPFDDSILRPSPASSDDESSGSSLEQSSPDSSPRSDAKLTPEKQPTPLKLSSSAIMSAALPPLSPDPLHAASLSDKDLKQQAPSIVGKAPVSPQQQDKGLVSKLGFNKDKSVPQQQQAPVARSSASVTPIRSVV